MAGNANSGRRKSDENDVVACGEVRRPSRMKAEERKMWESVVNGLPPGVLGACDQKPLEHLCQMFGLYTDAMKVCRKDPSNAPARATAMQAFDRWVRLCKEFGLTPNSRMELKARKQEAPDSPLVAIRKRTAG